MYSTFPPGAIPGIMPGHLFASTPYLAPNASASLLNSASNQSAYLGVPNSTSQRLNYSNTDHSATQESSGGVFGLPSHHHGSQEMFLMMQTMYHQQNVLQSQMGQLCLAVQHLQASMNVLLSGTHGPAAQQHAPLRPGQGISLDRDLAGEQPTQSAGHSHATVVREAPRQSSSHSMEGADPATSVDANQRLTPVSQIHPTHLSPTPLSSSVPLDPNPHRSPSKKGNASPPRSTAAPHYATTITTNAIFQSHEPDPTLDPTPNRPGTDVIQPRSVPPSPQQVIVTWDPRKYSRSSSVGSASHNTSVVAAQAAIPTVVLGGTGGGVGRSGSQQSTADDLPPQRHHSTARHHQGEHLFVDDRNAIDQRQHGAANSSLDALRESSHHSYLPRHAPKILEKVLAGSSASQNSSASDVRSHAGVFASRYSAPPPSAQQLPSRAAASAAYTQSYHDVSLSDDGYMSMDTAQYMERFHLK